MPTLTARSHHNIFGNGKFYIYFKTRQIFSLWNNAIHHMNFWVHTTSTYRAMSILGRVHEAFSNYHQFNEMTNIPDEIVLARIITALDLELERVLHYHDEGYYGDNDCGPSGQVMRTLHIYSVSPTEASFTPLYTREHNVPSHPSQQGNWWMSSLSIKESTNA